MIIKKDCIYPTKQKNRPLHIYLPDNYDQTSEDSSKVPSKFTSSKNISSTYGKKVKFSVKVLDEEGKAINHTLVTFKVSGKTYNVYTDQSGISSIFEIASAKGKCECNNVPSARGG